MADHKQSIEASICRSGAALVLDLDGRRIPVKEEAAAQDWVPDAIRLLVEAQLGLETSRLGTNIASNRLVVPSFNRLTAHYRRQPYRSYRVGSSTDDRLELARRTGSHLDRVDADDLDCAALCLYLLEYADQLGDATVAAQIVRLADAFVDIDQRNGEWLELGLAGYVSHLFRLPGGTRIGRLTWRWLARRWASHLVWSFPHRPPRLGATLWIQWIRWGALLQPCLLLGAWVVLMAAPESMSGCSWSLLLLLPTLIVGLFSAAIWVYRRVAFPSQEIVGSSLVGLLFLIFSDEVWQSLFTTPPGYLVIGVLVALALAMWFWHFQIAERTAGFLAGELGISSRAVRVLSIHLLLASIFCVGATLALGTRAMPLELPVSVTSIVTSLQCERWVGTGDPAVVLYPLVPLSVLVTMTGIVLQLWWQPER